MIKAVLWDMDGVLVDSERLVKEIFVELMTGKQCMDDPGEVYMQSIGLNPASIKALYRNYMPDDEAEACFHQVAEIYQSRMTSDLQMKPGVLEALQSVAELAIPQMVVTSTRFSSAQAKLDMFSLLPFFEGMICGDQVEHGKPHPESYLTACKRLGIAPESALIVEDSPNGVKAGISAGSMVVHVPDLVETDPDWHEQLFGALDSLESFPEWFFEMQTGVWV